MSKRGYEGDDHLGGPPLKRPTGYDYQSNSAYSNATPYNPYGVSEVSYYRPPVAAAPSNAYEQYAPGEQYQPAYHPPPAHGAYPPGMYPPPHQIPLRAPAPYAPYVLPPRPTGSGKPRCRHFARGFCQLGKDCKFIHSGQEGDMNRCRHWATKGFCSMADACQFSHSGKPGDLTVEQFVEAGGNAKLRPAAPPSVYRAPFSNPGGQFMPGRPAATTSDVCRHYARGFCQMGHNCRFLHGLPPKKRSSACRHFQKGFCQLGEKCLFSHVAVPKVPSESKSTEPAAVVSSSTTDSTSESAASDETAESSTVAVAESDADAV
eukprot:CAMPEP_0175145766 /NCGR_PEP_ID=MMETSP0087-20121206/14976_1 /TAXON_ID=136419 /ORGANISM="Unknown Unknown, Strain D1" /LENGTH=318 /DNA_ID=CAMNT_0016430595 /DNA_START=19 /DNA_END=975 /DNA_ORIENTATION=+